MSTAPATRVRLTDPSELIAAVPHLLGFHPRDSLVVISLDGRRLGMTLRADLVDPEHRELLAEQLTAPLVHQQHGGPGGDPGAGTLPHRCLVDAVDDVLAAEGIGVQHALWAASTSPGVPWCCYDEPGCAGTVGDPASSPMAAATVAAGAVTFASREELAGLLTPDPAEALARRGRLLAAADAEHPLDPATAARRVERLGQLHAAVAGGALVLDDAAVVEVASALCDHRVRDGCLAWSVGAGGAAAEQLWLALVRATPAPERAEPAALLACTAYLRGDGALAGLALEVALAACPEHALAGLLRAALDGGLPPDLLRSVARDAAAAAGAVLDSDEE
jgi:hypothetical protein